MNMSFYHCAHKKVCNGRELKKSHITFLLLQDILVLAFTIPIHCLPDSSESELYFHLYKKFKGY